MLYSVTLPSAPATFTCTQMCGFVHWNSFTVPSMVCSFSLSNIAKE